MIPNDDHWWRTSLQLKLMLVSGTSFQTFFSNLMKMRYKEDFVKVGSLGSLGDKGCDGYRLSTGTVYQCYGAENGNIERVTYLAYKMKSDFAKSNDKLEFTMREWKMVHNLNNLPVFAVEGLETLKRDNPDIKIGVIGPEGMESIAKHLSREQKEELLGPISTNYDARNLQPRVLRNLIDNLVNELGSKGKISTEIEPVSKHKINENNLSRYWISTILAGWSNAHIVNKYMNGQSNPLLGQEIAQMFHEQYSSLKAQDLDACDIMAHIYRSMVGTGLVETVSEVAAFSLLAHLFESCDIFENFELR